MGINLLEVSTGRDLGALTGLNVLSAPSFAITRQLPDIGFSMAKYRCDLIFSSLLKYYACVCKTSGIIILIFIIVLLRGSWPPRRLVCLQWGG